jgi:hypothetical protein
VDPEQDSVLDVTYSGAAAIALPSAHNLKGKTFTFKVSSITGKVRIDPVAGENIDGATALILCGQYATYTLMSNGANWILIGKTEGKGLNWFQAIFYWMSSKMTGIPHS